MTVTRIDKQIDNLIRQIEAGERIHHDRELLLAGLNFVADSLDSQRSEDERLAGAGAEQASAVR